MKRGYILLCLLLALVVFMPQDLHAQQESYTISGTVVDTGGRGIDWIQIAFFDGEGTVYETTAGEGFYSHNVGSGWSGTVTPSDACYLFSPASASIGPVTSNTVQNFTGTRLTFTISGFVTDGVNPIDSVLLTLSTGGATLSGTDGSYSLTVPCGWGGTVTPMKVGWVFSPPSNYYEWVDDDLTGQDFTGTASSSTYTISGTVQEEAGRTGMDGVTITFYDGSTLHEEITSGGGNYSYTVPINWTGTVTPSLAGYTFSPVFAAIGLVTSNTTQDFTASSVTVTISGTVIGEDFNPIVGVTLTASSGGTATTDGNGIYSFSFGYGWSGNITPSRAGWIFDPTQRNYINVVTDQTGQTYVGHLRRDRFTISGTVTAGGLGLENVTMNGLPGTPSTDASGYYSALVNYGWSGTVSPAKDGYLFTPSNLSYSNVTSDQSNQNYTALAGNPVISGAVKNINGIGISGVPMDFSNSGGSVTTDENGDYSNTVPSGWSGTVTPTKQGYIFDPTSRSYTNVISDQTNENYVTMGPPVISLSKNKLNFGTHSAGIAPDPQSFMVSNSGGGTLNWTISVDQAWLNCTPTSGTNSGTVTVSVDPTGLADGTYSGTVSVTDSNASNSPQTVSVQLKVYSSTEPPFGVFSTPIDGSTVYSSIPVTGWALDDIGVESVKIYLKENGSLAYIGEAVFVEGARPDVELYYPDYPNNSRAGWGYMMLTYFLPNGGNGTYTFCAIATDVEGNEVTLDTKTVTVDNANAVKPFGAIDSPTQGGEASGNSFKNSGWVLTPQPNKVPEDGSTINVYVNGVNLGHPTYNIYREDIATLFPGYANSNGAHAYFDFDTTAYGNGVHTIYWTATDDAGNTDGIGSRFFTIQNTGSSSSLNRATGLNINIEDLKKMPVYCNAPVRLKKGFRKDAELQAMSPDKEGISSIHIKEVECMEIKLSDDSSLISGYMIVGDQLRALPIGSTLDTNIGKFLWQPGPGFVGLYRLVFVLKGQDGKLSRKDIIVNIGMSHESYDFENYL